MPAGQHVALQPALADVLAQHLHHAAVRRHVVVDWRSSCRRSSGSRPRRRRPAGSSWSRPGRTGGSLPASALRREDVAQHLAELPRDSSQVCPMAARPAARSRGKSGMSSVDQQLAAVGVRIGAHAARRPLGASAASSGTSVPLRVEQLLRLVAAHPALELAQVLGIGLHLGQRHLMRAEGPLDRQAVDHLRARPALGRAQDDRGPARPSS